MNIKALLKSLLLRRFSTVLLLLQLALTLGLIVNSVILALDTREKLLRPTGLALDNLLVVESRPTSSAFKDKAYYRSIIDQDLLKLGQIGGVKAVSPQIQLPIQNGGWRSNMHDVNDSPETEHDKELDVIASYLSTPDALASFGINILEGRALTWADEAQDQENSEYNIVISGSLAKALYPNQSAVGKLTNRGRIVGTVENFINRPTLPDSKQFYFFMVAPIDNSAFTHYYLLNVESGQMAQVRAKVRDVILGVQPERDIMDVYTMAERHSEYYQQDTGLAGLFTMLCILMLIVTAISSYAHAQFHISQQKKLIGIRRALGARKKDILLYVLSENWLINVLGALLGIAFVIGFNMLLSAQISISQPSIWLYLAVTLLVFVAGTIATWIPAYQTSKIPPVIATRTV
ncbi:FtsX-like permease family protein [Paraglaciecola sp.]|uniref:FtsX-like permease family protein n=1 Tax=Paraglaciecola sp. TaxID=1920173 RepID=UPI0030F3B6BE